MTDLPDIEGFREAQARLVNLLGTDVTFFFAASAYVYASGTAIDPQTGMALDPSIGPVSIESPSPIVARATITKVGLPPKAPSEEGQVQRLGIVPTGDVWLRLPVGHFDTAIYDSRAFSAWGEMYLITRFMFGGLDSEADHVVIRGVLSDGIDMSSIAGVNAAMVRTGITYQESFIATSGQAVFSTLYPFVAGTTQVFIDGMLQARGADKDYTEGDSSITITDNSMVAGQVVVIAYERAA